MLSRSLIKSNTWNHSYQIQPEFDGRYAMVRGEGWDD